MAFPDPSREDDRHISGVYSLLVMDWMAEGLSEQAIASIITSAGDTRSIDELRSFATWSSYDQFRRLLEAARTGLEMTRIGFRYDSFDSLPPDYTEITETIRSFGSPEALLTGASGADTLVPIRRFSMTEIGQRDYLIREHFIDGFPAYPEFCACVARQFRMIPMFFGLPPAEVVEEACQCWGDDECVFHMRWEQADDPSLELSDFKVQSQLLEARLEQLQDMVMDLASNERYEDVLQGIVASSTRAVGAEGALLALEARPGFPESCYYEGLSKGKAWELARHLLGTGEESRQTASADVVSARRHYGVLAIGESGAFLASQSAATLQTYARLAAAALDAADAIEDARHQASTARILLELSTSLADIVSTEATASKLVRAVPEIIDCDRAAIFLTNSEQGWSEGEGVSLVASLGYPEGAAELLGTGPFAPTFDTHALDEEGTTRCFHTQVGADTAIVAPIVGTGTTIGFIVAGVTSGPDRLDLTPRVIERLTGLAAQASIALSNSTLVDQIRYQAVHDPLTGLANRALILDRTEQMLARARRTGASVAALFVDLDGFKEVNDTMGHGVGDRLLQAVGERLSAAMRESDSVGRLGGDEFVVLVDRATTDAGPQVVAARLLDVLGSPFELEGATSGPITVTASIGISMGTRPTADELLRDADTALYAAKGAGKNCFVVFEPEMRAAVLDHDQLEVELRGALAAQQFFLVYQPIFNLASGETTGVEALLRWRHPDRGVLLPDAFLGILEDSGLITDVGRWVVEEACRQGARWNALGYLVDVSVNVSARELQADRFIDDVRAALETSLLDPSSLIIEISETDIMKDEAVASRLGELKGTGVHIAIDDFGTGYSSLADLHRLPVDTLKIDRYFIASMAASAESGSLIRALVQLGKTLGLETLAEGIEDQEQYSQLVREHCDRGQGFLYARPLEADVVDAFLAARATTVVPSAPR
jgi:diguanylate cyclase (GGDEF)-like protein